MEASNLLQVKGLVKRYKDFFLDNIDLNVPQGAVVGLVGVNGAGKTTLMKCALGLVRINDGSIALFGEETQGISEHRMAELKQRIGVVFDSLPFPPDMTPADVGRIMAKAYDAWNQSTYEATLKDFDLPDKKPVKEFSRGMGMKLQFACALSHDADLLLLDEATAGLDPIARDEVIDLLRAYMDDTRGVLLSSHITSDLEKLADYIVCIDGGRIAFAVEKSSVIEIAGIAHCRAVDIDNILENNLLEKNDFLALKRPNEVSVLVPDRFAFAKSFPDIATDCVDLDSYMTFRLKGERL